MAAKGQTTPRTRGTFRRRKAQRWGGRAEWLCRLRLRLCGWRILAANWRSPVGEIDIVAQRGRVLAFVEVKARPDLAEPGPHPRQRRRIARAAQLFVAQHPRLASCFARFDVMFVRPWPHLQSLWPSHIADAWRMDELGISAP